jgi:hypothetical protein
LSRFSGAGRIDHCGVTYPKDSAIGMFALGGGALRRADAFQRGFECAAHHPLPMHRGRGTVGEGHQGEPGLLADWPQSSGALAGELL